MTRHGFGVGVHGPHGSTCPPLPLRLVKARPSIEMQRWGMGEPKKRITSSWGETTAANNWSTGERKQRQKVLGIGLDGSGSRRRTLADLNEAAGPGARQDIGKLAHRYGDQLPVVQVTNARSSSSARTQPKWKPFPALSRRELKQKLGVQSGSLPQEVLSQTMHAKHIPFADTPDLWNDDNHFPATAGDFRSGCDDGLWFNDEDVRFGRAPALGDVRDQMFGPPPLGPNRSSAKMMRSQSRRPTHCPASGPVVRLLR